MQLTVQVPSNIDHANLRATLQALGLKIVERAATRTSKRKPELWEPDGYAQGPLTVGGHPRDNSGTAWREILGQSEFGPCYIGQMLHHNADRAVACWNACEGIPTATLQEKSRKSAYTDQAHLLIERETARAQRDELLAALEAVDEFWAGGDAPAALTAQMRAAIAKARK